MKCKESLERVVISYETNLVKLKIGGSHGSIVGEERVKKKKKKKKKKRN